MWGRGPQGRSTVIETPGGTVGVTAIKGFGDIPRRGGRTGQPPPPLERDRANKGLEETGAGYAVAMRVRWILVLAAVAAAVIVARRLARHPDASGDVVPKDPRPQRALVDLASEESFPASDPPSYWGREAD